MGETAEAAQPPTRVGATTTGKEEDIDVGLTYFGKRYLSPYLNRWISPDPLAIHSPGEADLNVYAYVKGQALKSTDPVGLDEDNESDQPVASNADGTVQTYAGHPVTVVDEVTITPSETFRKDLSAEMHDREVIDLIQQYRATSYESSPSGSEFGPDYDAWDRAREDYRQVFLKGGDPTLRDTEHFLFRYWMSSELGETKWIPRGVPLPIPDSWTGPKVPSSSIFMQDVFDPTYNAAREVADDVLPIAPTTPEMHQWEQRGYDYGYHAGGYWNFKQDLDDVLVDAAGLHMFPVGQRPSGLSPE